MNIIKTGGYIPVDPNFLPLQPKVIKDKSGFGFNYSDSDPFKFLFRQKGFLNSTIARDLAKFESTHESIKKHWEYLAKKNKKDGLFQANTFIRKLSDGDHPYKINDFMASASDQEIEQFADRKSKWAAIRIASGHLSEVLVLLNDFGFEVPYKKGTKFQVSVERLRCKRWWIRQFRKLGKRTVDQHARDLGKVRLGREVYCANFTYYRRLKQKSRNEKTLKTLVAENDNGYSATLFDLQQTSMANPRIRRAELMTRIRGFETIANEMDYDGFFLTLTCPSSFHPESKKYNGATPREAQDFLCKQFAKARAALKRENLPIFGLRVVEPHGDGTPHWHLLFFMDKEHSARVLEIFWHYAFEVDGTEQGAIEARFNIKKIDKNRGSAAGYIAKYICKNIDGTYQLSDGTDVVFDDKDSNLKSNHSAQKIEAWASAWGIRQFQQVGGVPVTIWRELRRLRDDDVMSPRIRLAFEAANQGDWCAFLKAMGGVTASRKEQLICLLKKAAEKPNCYGEIKVDSISGVIDKETGECNETRKHIWTIKFLTKAKGIMVIKIIKGEGIIERTENNIAVEYGLDQVLALKERP